MVAKSTSRKKKARQTVCGAHQGFRNTGKAPRSGSKSPCVDCKCKETKDGKNSDKCTLYPYSSNCCPDGKTPHHIIPKHCFKRPVRNYSGNRAPCICVTGHDKSDKSKQHAKIHDKFDPIEDARKKAGEPAEWTYEEAREAGIASVRNVEPFDKCSEECLRAQLDDYHLQTCKMEPTDMLLADSTGGKKAPVVRPRAKAKGGRGR